MSRASPATMRIDTTGLRAEVDAMRKAAPGAQEAALAAVVAQGAQFMVRVAPRETNAYVVGWQNANNAAGLPAMPVDPIVENPRTRKIFKRLTQQHTYWARRVEQFENAAAERKRERSLKPRRGRPPKTDIPQRWPSYRRAVKQRDRAAQQIERFAQAQGRVVAIRGSRSADGDTARALDTVRVNLGQGFGRRIRVGGAVFIELENRNPHARFVERNHRVVARARAAVRQVGVRTIAGRYRRELLFREAANLIGSGGNQGGSV